MRLLVIGDVIGRPGRRAVKSLVPGLRRDLQLDLVIANGENAAGGKGLTPVIRPLNYPPGVPGRGYLWWKTVLVVNLAGRTFMGDADCPFRVMDQLLRELPKAPSAIIVDFHAEATSEKNALGRYLDGRVSAVLGTHTHVGTADARILPHGTAFITDIGMVGPIDSVIGDDADEVIHRFLTQMPHRLSVGKGPVLFNSVLLEIDQTTGKATSIIRVDRQAE